jgi:cell division protein ZapA
VNASPAKTVLVRILDKEYQVACPPDQAQDLLAAARQLDAQMRTIRDSGKVIGLERIAVMVALNSTYELLKRGGGDGDAAAAASQEQLKRLNERIDDALQRFRQLEIG